MAIEFKKTAVSGRFPEIWRGECKILPGGFKPLQSFAVGTVLRRAALLEVNFKDMTAAVIKLADVLAGGTTKAVRVAKGHYFAVGDVITKVGDGKSTPSISSIDTSNVDYDVLTLSAAYTGLKAGDTIVESVAVESGDATSKYTPNMIVGADKEFNGKGIPAIDAAYEAVVLYPSLSFTIPAEWLNGPCVKSNPNILFIKQ